MKKICTQCHTEKVLDDFNKQAKGKHGRMSACRDCTRARQAQYRKDNPEAARASAKKYRENHPETVKARMQKWNDENPGRMQELKAEWRKNNRDKQADYNRKWREENPEAVRENVRKFQDKVKSEVNANASNTGKKWTAEDLEVLLREDLSVLEMSKQLERTYASVAVMRQKHIEHVKRLAIIEDVQRRLAG